ncbi:hypothetical protein LTR84_002138 [Exophiala bonariae]|uniref:DNA polymerase zeta catalytic subunit n=1 Tax=Exophiala bonariae TaxID=1690606 RepID=A0AAV9ND42_9EURO|nr:hypothetical protein LTR84_002138 [Exophiala bonariae]
METFRVRLNCLDHYQALPLDDFDPPLPLGTTRENVKERPRISVIRVFGATDTGQKVLMHIHGALQYTYIEYSGSLLPEDVEVAIRTLQLSIDHALAVSYRKNIYEGKHRYVAHISLVKAIPFYGFHVGYRFYLKIYLLNPLHMTRLADLLREGAVMKRVLQPYESHMQYLAQWMCDYNLYGCSYIECCKVKFRGPVPNYFDLTNAMHQWHDRSISPEDISDESSLPKQSHCTLEVDVHVKDIMNRSNVESRQIHHDFIERVNPLPIDAKLVQSMAGLWKDETRRRKTRMGLKDPNSTPFPAEVLISMSADVRNTSDGGWIHEEEFRQKIAQLAKAEFEQSDRNELQFETFVKPVALEDNVKTALESVEDLYPGKLIDARASNADRNTGINDLNDLTVESESRILVDESRAQDIANGLYRSSDESPPSDTVTATANENEDGLKQPGTNGEVTTPISSSEYAEYGIRPAGDFIHVEQDTFTIPDEYLQHNLKDSTSSKRTRQSKVPDFKPRKRRKQLVDEDDFLPEMTFSGSEDDPDFTADADELLRAAEPSISEKHLMNGSTATSKVLRSTEQTAVLRDLANESNAPPASSQQSTLAFPAVKNPHDPNTILRLSQRSSPSQNLSQASLDKTVTLPYEPKTPAKSGVSISQQTILPSTTGKSSTFGLSQNFMLKGLVSSKPTCSLEVYQARAPSFKEVDSTMWQEGLPDVIYQDAYYSNEEDVPELARQYAGREFKLESTTVPFLPDFDPSGSSLATFGRKPAILLDQTAEQTRDNQRRKRCTISQWSIAQSPPRKVDVEAWLGEYESNENLAVSAPVKPSTQTKKHSQIDGPTQKGKHGFKYTQKQSSTSVQHETQYMSTMALEVHVNTRGALAHNPDEDAVACIFWCLQTDDEDLESNGIRAGLHMGILAVADEPHTAKMIGRNVHFDVEEESSELDVLTRLVDIVRYHDPDILTGYEVHNNSWGFLIERARIKYDLNLCDEISRMKSQSHGRFGKDDDRWGFNHTSTIRVTGRHTINIWRAMRGELNLLQYTMENVVYHLLHQRIPHYSFRDLTNWYKSKNPRDLAKVVEYFSTRVQLDIEILEANELIPRTSEQARLLGVDWFSVISRGSQFKVESLMFRIAKPENFMLVSPSRRQVGGQNALECLPLVMEPQSDFYTSPLLVLDFQSLYPSVMIAYNYCYSTFLGRVVNWRGTNKMGFSDYRREQRLIELLKDYINVAPNGIMYAKTEIRKSLLAKMLSEILETRVMVKSGMKVDKDDKVLQRLLNNRQLALKLIANVTYGYTSASFSGRMPCSEIADSIVQTGRETLEKAIAFIHSVEKWGAEVVYGDTDSLFVYLKGRTREQAFDIGEDIAATITKMNPRPVKLKFEKVYHPCVLLAKKRYVGFKYESRTQTVPDFDAKGIETVRRDGTPAEQKIEETALKILFRTSNLSQVKSFFQAQCAKIMQGRVSIQDFCFAREVKLGTYSDKGPPPPGALISARRMLEDPRLEPQYGERVPYVVVTGGPGARLIDRCVAPDVLLNDAHSDLDAEYYISKNLIPPLERIFNLVGANVRQWYDEMPKYQRIRRVEAGPATEGREIGGPSKKTLESYMKSSTCLVCRQSLDSESPICNNCFQQGPRSIVELRSRLIRAERKAAQMAKVCRSCSGLGWNEEIRCDSKDCPVFYSRTRQKAAVANEHAVVMPVLRSLEMKQEGNDDLACPGRYPVIWFLFVYVLGGITFLPLLIILVLAHAYYTLPPAKDSISTDSIADDPAQLSRSEDDKSALKSATDDLAEKFHRKHDSDVAAGYFAVCREYVPGGVNGKPPERLTPAGEVVAQESPSVYQTMYRSIFDRSQKPTIEPNKDATGKSVKRSNNVFYVVLRHGHLMLYDDIQQLEVRYVISLEYHDVDIYGGGEDIPEGEIWIKRNAIRLTRKRTRAGDKTNSLPFFFFSENLSEKEDFYFALLKNLEKSDHEDVPIPQDFDVKHIVMLVQKLHSSEEHLQTRWLNAFIGRMFLAMYRTPDLERFIRTKLTKKISRVKKPNFITKLALRKIDLGNSAPFITNPRLKDLTVNGDCTAEADVNYTGMFRIEIAATARIELGTRFKPREVDMVLAATCKKLEGHVLLRFKPAPSNRLWFTFEKMPQMDLALESIVSTRQITYNVILRAIESRIREVIAETIVLPFWDDMPFHDTSHERYRGGIWKKDPVSAASTDIPNEEPEDAAEAGLSGTTTPADMSKDERILSMPALADTKGLAKSNSARKSTSSFSEILGLKSSEPAEKPDPPTPRLMRSPSFASAATPTITSNHADMNPPPRNGEGTPRSDSVASFLKGISKSGSGSASPSGSQTGSPPTESAMASVMKERTGSVGSKGSNDGSAQQSELQSSNFADSPIARTPTTMSTASFNSTNQTDLKRDGSRSSQESNKPKGFAQAARSLTTADRKQAMASITAASVAAQRWSWGVLARNKQRESQALAEGGTSETGIDSPATIPREPMGRGRPLPPPGIPLPPPEKPIKNNTFSLPKRKAVPPPLLPQRPDSSIQGEPSPARSSPRPPTLPDRRRRQSSMLQDGDAESEVLVVEAPMESAPTSPAPGQDEHHDDFFGHGEPAGNDRHSTPPPLPARDRDSPPNYEDDDLRENQDQELDRQEIGMYT